MSPAPGESPRGREREQGPPASGQFACNGNACWYQEYHQSVNNNGMGMLAIVVGLLTGMVQLASGRTSPGGQNGNKSPTEPEQPGEQLSPGAVSAHR